MEEKVIKVTFSLLHKLALLWQHLDKTNTLHEVVQVVEVVDVGGLESKDTWDKEYDAKCTGCFR